MSADREDRRTPAKPVPNARITCQFRDKGGMVYELDCQGTRLAVTILDTESETEPWQVGAGLREDGAPPALAAQGQNRSDALHAVVEAWDRAGYARMDWEAIRVALVAVRAV